MCRGCCVHVLTCQWRSCIMGVPRALAVRLPRRQPTARDSKLGAAAEGLAAVGMGAWVAACPLCVETGASSTGAVACRTVLGLRLLGSIGWAAAACATTKQRWARWTTAEWPAASKQQPSSVNSWSIQHDSCAVFHKAGLVAAGAATCHKTLLVAPAHQTHPRPCAPPAAANRPEWTALWLL